MSKKPTKSKSGQRISDKRERKYRDIFEIMEEAYYEVDLQGHLTFFNSAAVKQLGYTNDEAMGMNFRQFVDENNARKVFDAFHEVFLSGKTIKGFDWEFINKHGERIPVESSVTLRLDENGAPAGFRGVVRDISERKKTEIALRESEDRSRLIADNAKVVIWMMDLDLKHTYISPYITHNLDYTPEEYVKKPLHEILTPSSLDLCMQLFAEELENEKRPDKDPTRSRTIEVEQIHRDGRIIWSELNMTFIRDSHGNATGILGFTKDITERRQVREQLRKSEERYRVIFENTGNASVIFGEDRIIQLANSNFCKLSGYSKQESEGKMSWTQFVHPEDLGRMEKRHAMGGTGAGIVPESYEFRAVARNGDVMHIFMNISLIPGTNVSIASMMDITERKRVEAALQQSEAKYRFLAENMNDVMWTADLDLNMTYVSLSVEKVVGFTQEERLHQKPQDMMTPESYARTILLLFEELKREQDQDADPGRTVTFEAEYYHKNGSIVWIENVVSAIRDESGKLIGIYGVSRDISERKRTEEIIRKSEEGYRTIFENTATANVIVAEDSTILLANSNFAHTVGYSKQEMEGKMKWTGFVVPEDLQMIKRYNRMRKQKPDAVPSSYEIRIRDRKGEIQNLFLSVAVIPETNDSIASMINITEWKRSEKARSESEERFKDLAELLPETVYEADENGIFLFVNKTGFDKFGYGEEDLARKLTVFDMIMPDDHARMIATYQRLIKGERVGLGEYTARRKDGGTFPALVYATAIFREGKPFGHRGFIIDISEKKNLENQIIRSQKMESIGTLAGGIAHDFNNLLMGILGNISLILLQVDPSNPIYERLKNMEGYVQRGSDLTKQLLGFARGGKYEVQLTDLGELISRSSELFGRTKKEVHIHRNFPKGLWAVEVDQGQLEQVLLNLYVNAWQAMPGGGDLYISAENIELDEVEVIPHDIHPGIFVKVTVTDTGIGMDEVTKTRVFEPFFTTKERGRGTGLGLASAYGIVKNHGGIILVESEIGIGSSFIIYLPASEKKIEVVQTTREAPMRGEETILLIDDEDMILEVGSRILETLGYQVIPADGGRQGLQVYERDGRGIDLVVLDMIMPGFGGRETFDALMAINPAVKVLLSSGYSLDGQAKDIMQKGCKGFIQKPFTMIDLSKKIREILDT